MLAHERQAYILSAASRDGTVRVADLVDRLRVSNMTIRRDLNALASRGLVSKVYGGATLVQDGISEEPGFTAKSSQQRPEKTGIARAAVLAPFLRGVPGITAVTNSVRVANELQRDGGRDRTVVLTGGERTPSDALVGPVTVSSLRTLHLDLLFLGVHGMHERAGLTTPNLREAETNRAFISSAARLVTLADHTKWGVVGLCEIAPLGRTNTLVTDEHLPEEAYRVLRAHVDDVVLAPVPGPAPDG